MHWVKESGEAAAEVLEPIKNISWNEWDPPWNWIYQCEQRWGLRQ
jgi:hypothetical protein